MLIAHVEHVAIPHPGLGDHPGYAWCKRPGCLASIEMLRWMQPGGLASVEA